MHESRTVADLIAEAERRVEDNPGKIIGLRFRIGALAATSPAALVHGITTSAAARWQTTPSVEVEVAGDPTDQGAHGVTLVAMKVVD